MFSEWLSSDLRRPLVMGVLNITPDSFSDGARYMSLEAALQRARQMSAAGADLIDIGGESTRPGSARVDADQQIHRLRPLFQALGREKLSAVLSIDTTLAPVARMAIEAGCQLVNDISAGRDDPAMFSLVAATGVGMVLMHMQGQPATMQQSPAYRNVVGEVRDFLAERLDAAAQAGIAFQRLLIDPGIGFGKTDDHNLTLLRHIAEFKVLGRPIVVGASRKGFLGRLGGQDTASDRVFETAATISWCIANEVDMVRVHDVEAMARVVRVARAIGDAQ